MRTGLMIAAVAVLLVVANSLFMVREYESGALFRLGAITRSDIPPGLHMKVPFIESVRRFDRRLLTLDAMPERYLTSEKKDVTVDFFAKWRINDVTQFFVTTSGDQLQVEQRLNPILKEALRNQFNQRTLQETVSDARSSMTETLVAQSNEAAKTLGIEVIDVRIKRIELPEEVSESVYNRMRSEREREAAVVGLVLAEQRIAEAAAESELRDRAQGNTRRMLEGMFSSLGFEVGTITFVTP